MKPKKYGIEQLREALEAVKTFGDQRNFHAKYAMWPTDVFLGATAAHLKHMELARSEDALKTDSDFNVRKEALDALDNIEGVLAFYRGRECVGILKRHNVTRAEDALPLVKTIRAALEAKPEGERDDDHVAELIGEAGSYFLNNGRADIFNATQIALFQMQNRKNADAWQEAQQNGMALVPIEHLETLNQFVLEVAHAHSEGPWWFTNGEKGLATHIRSWIIRATKAKAEIAAAKEKGGA